VDRQ